MSCRAVLFHPSFLSHPVPPDPIPFAAAQGERQGVAFNTRVHRPRWQQVGRPPVASPHIGCPLTAARKLGCTGGTAACSRLCLRAVDWLRVSACPLRMPHRLHALMAACPLWLRTPLRSLLSHAPGCGSHPHAAPPAPPVYTVHTVHPAHPTHPAPEASPENCSPALSQLPLQTYVRLLSHVYLCTFYSVPLLFTGGIRPARLRRSLAVPRTSRFIGMWCGVHSMGGALAG